MLRLMLVSWAGLRGSRLSVVSCPSRAVDSRVGRRKCVGLTLLEHQMKWQGSSWCSLPDVPELLIRVLHPNWRRDFNGSSALKAGK